MKKLFSLLGLLAILSACIKEAEVSKYPIQMTFDTLEPVTKMRFFIGGTELNPKYHEETVNGFLDRYYSTKTGTGVISYQSKFTEPNVDSYSNAYFTFDDRDEVKFSAVSKIIDVKRYDGVTVMKSAITNKIEDVPIVKSDLFKYKFEFNANGSYNYQYVVYEHERSLEVPLLYYKLVRYDEQGNRTDLAFGTMHNEFNESFIKTLTERDTLAIKEYRLTYSIK